MFTSLFKESTTREVTLPSVDGETLKSLVKYSYLGCIEIEEGSVQKLLVTADSLLLGAVVNACGDFLVTQLHPTNCLGMVQLAERHLCETLSRKAKEFCMEHFVELYKTDEFLSLNAEQLSQLLASDDLRVPNEADVFKSLMAWLAYDPIERGLHKDDLMKLVRMPLIEPSFLIQHVRSVCTSTETRELYDAATDWHLLPRNRTPNSSKSTKPRRTKDSLMALTWENEKLYLRHYCPQRSKWVRWLNNLDNTSNAGVAVVRDNLFIVGGSVLGSVICLNLQTMTLKHVNPMNICRRGVAVIAFKGFLYAVGGKNGNYFSNVVEKWDPQLNNWSTVAVMAFERDSCALEILNDELYAVGGANGRENPMRSVEVYDSQANNWTTITSMCEARRDHGVAVYGGMLYAVGGLGSKTIERYDPKTDKWTMICNLSQQIPLQICTSFNDKILIFFNNRVEEYSPEANEWKVNDSIRRLDNAYRIFSYSGELLVSKFVEN